MRSLEEKVPDKLKEYLSEDFNKNTDKATEEYLAEKKLQESEEE